MSGFKVSSTGCWQRGHLDVVIWTAAHLRSKARCSVKAPVATGGFSSWRSPWCCWRCAGTRSSPPGSGRRPSAWSDPRRRPAPRAARRCCRHTRTPTRWDWGRWWWRRRRGSGRGWRTPRRSPPSWWWRRGWCGTQRTRRGRCSGPLRSTGSPFLPLPGRLWTWLRSESLLQLSDSRRSVLRPDPDDWRRSWQ